VCSIDSMRAQNDPDEVESLGAVFKIKEIKNGAL
jgi:hypothetical protein